MRDVNHCVYTYNCELLRILKEKDVGQETQIRQSFCVILLTRWRWVNTLPSRYSMTKS